jgi:hypothetical protein
MGHKVPVKITPRCNGAVRALVVIIKTECAEFMASDLRLPF